MNISAILTSTYIISILGLLVFIWSLRKGGGQSRPTGGRVIFEPGEVGQIEEPSADAAKRQLLQNISDAGGAHALGPVESRVRHDADMSTAKPVLLLLSTAVIWLVVGSVAGLISSVKLHEPDWLVRHAVLTFGRLRSVHLNAVAYGWTSLAALGIATWLLPRLLRTPLRGAHFTYAGALLWNIGLMLGLYSVAMGVTDGMEWLEIPWHIGGLFAIGGALMGVPLLLMLPRAQVDHLYVSVWYIGAALFWFPILYVVAKIPGLHVGVQQATMNWWFGHNVLGYFFTPMALAAVYYFVPKVIGRPVQSYDLSLLGFWTLAFFYGQVGAHHLIGGPIPVWLVTLSIVQSVMMVIPVIAFSVNQHLTMRGHFSALKYSHTLRFVLFGAMMYTVASVQGSMEALRAVNNVTHFTHFTVAHAHLGMYGFVAMVLFGAAYFAMPRVLDIEWPRPKLISLHFGLVLAGFAVYIIALSAGGWLQGLALLDPARPFIDSVTLTLPFLKGRSLGGLLMTAGHLVFAYHFGLMFVARLWPAFVQIPSDPPRLNAQAQS
ncbi:cbb3-type cytochrome c oxidase subunit I [Steroidobacter cummioxidans]|uniref:cbb3-type cytochrome c oxidase subunit I n=1 Tax=Steroidobacter cummioxidans TaxID=1803913 RepID=UPI000E31FB2B|nr:cbb3-type cytochrome c oxidase subunit I [Steroidobacter cummioxidans]